MTRLGREYVKECRRQYGKALQSLGYNLEGFLTNLTGLCDMLKTNSSLKTKNDVPSLICNNVDGCVVLHFFTNREPIRCFVGGVIEGVSSQIFSRRARVACEKCDTPNGNRTSHRFYFKTKGHYPRRAGAATASVNGRQNGHRTEIYESASAKDSKIGVSSFCKAFPWHFVCNKAMRITQMGSAKSPDPWPVARSVSITVRNVFGSQPLRHNEEVSTCFSLTSPDCTSLTYDQVIGRINTPFVLAFRYQQSSRLKVKNMGLKGQMVVCPESDSLLFVGSPLLDGLRALTSHGLYLSDIPIHDATRDVILVGEQSRAQDGLKRRMVQLKDSIEETNNQVDKEREKNVSLLHLIFPPDIAKRLWIDHFSLFLSPPDLLHPSSPRPRHPPFLPPPGGAAGETIQAQKHDEVTMLFSDIVASPPSSLYTQFDAFCGQLDVYKVGVWRSVGVDVSGRWSVVCGRSKPSIASASRSLNHINFIPISADVTARPPLLLCFASPLSLTPVPHSCPNPSSHTPPPIPTPIRPCISTIFPSLCQPPQLSTLNPLHSPPTPLSPPSPPFPLIRSPSSFSHTHIHAVSSSYWLHGFCSRFVASRSAA
ncbi:Head-specific guanylate cyclase [Penaeus vannamei]|uniref:guanylate cyclase n=1 Tax=Penaeus vannamei TaxID=6689 RepID=A0A3R7MFE9_PENVA|nr:Head-specific guanylate cyclase [Penaeus vannamei]